MADNNQVTQWEYKRFGPDVFLNEEKLNKLGADGWEMAGTYSGNNSQFSTVFKRQKQISQQTEPDYGYSR
ncbi:MAG: hypothetical protein IJ688_00560 [Treponema sp.]|nr:hypothetical protein [Treponema sp.]